MKRRYNNYYDVFFTHKDTSLEGILAAIAKAADVNIDAMKARSKKRELADARHAFFIVAMNYSNKSTTKIGEILNRDHATVLHAKKNAHIQEVQNIIRKAGY